MALVKKDIFVRSVNIMNFTVRPPRFYLHFKVTLEDRTVNEWKFATPNGSMLELGRVTHSWLRHGLIPAGAEEVKTDEK